MARQSSRCKCPETSWCCNCESPAECISTPLGWSFISHARRQPPSEVLYGELLEGNRKRGGQKLRYKDVLKRHTRCAKINSDTWEQEASSRPAWRSMLHQATKTVWEIREANYQSAHDWRHTVLNASDFTCAKWNRTCRSKAGLAAHLRAGRKKLL